MVIKSIRFIFSFLTWASICVFSILAIYTVASNVSIFKGYSPFLVQSGSMEPTIHIGDVVITHPQTQYNKLDVVTFRSPENQRVVTHRLVAENKDEINGFITKGDANRDEDEATITPSDIIGKVVFVIPKIGFLISFSQTIPGLVILILLPALGIIFDEAVKILAKKHV